MRSRSAGSRGSRGSRCRRCPRRAAGRRPGSGGSAGPATTARPPSPTSTRAPGHERVAPFAVTLVGEVAGRRQHGGRDEPRRERRGLELCERRRRVGAEEVDHRVRPQRLTVDEPGDGVGEHRVVRRLVGRAQARPRREDPAVPAGSAGGPASCRVGREHRRPPPPRPVRRRRSRRAERTSPPLRRAHNRSTARASSMTTPSMALPRTALGGHPGEHRRARLIPPRPIRSPPAATGVQVSPSELNRPPPGPAASSRLPSGRCAIGPGVEPVGSVALDCQSQLPRRSRWRSRRCRRPR